MTLLAEPIIGGTRATHALRPNPLNPRGPVDPASVGELADSIRAQGILQPLVITPDGVVVCGHRRLAAAILAGLSEVPVVVRDLDESNQLQIMIVENVQRNALTPVQEARAYQQLVELGINQHEIARRCGVNAARVKERLVILRLDPQVQELFDRLALPVTLARVLLPVTDPVTQRRLALIAGRRQMSVPQFDELVKKNLGLLPTTSRSHAPVAVVDEDDAVTAGPGGVNRTEALALLEATPARSIDFRALAAAFADTCCACGMTNSPNICDNCPLPDLIGRIARLGGRIAA